MILTDNEIKAVIAMGENFYVPKAAQNHMTYAQFNDLYGRDTLAGMAKDDKLLKRLFGSKAQDINSLTYITEHDDKRFGEFYGSAFNRGNTNKTLSYSRAGEWNEAKGKHAISESTAIDIADKIRNSLVVVLDKISRNTALDAVGICDLLKANDLPWDNQSWLKKYFTALYPDKFMPMTNKDWINRIFIPLGLIPTFDWYQDSVTFATKAQSLDIDCLQLYHATCKCLIDQIRSDVTAKGLDASQLSDTDLLINTEDGWKAWGKNKLHDQFGKFLADRYQWDLTNMVGKTRGKKAAPEEAAAPAPEEAAAPAPEAVPAAVNTVPAYIRLYAELLKKSKNVIFRGAPGTGKSYLAKQIAACIVTDGDPDGATADYKALKPEQKNQTQFVQFHPSYDYSDFVEGLRPCKEGDTLGFRLQDGTFKTFVERARTNFENSQKTIDTIVKETTIEEKIAAFLEKSAEKSFTTQRGSAFSIQTDGEQNICVSIPKNKISHTLTIKIDDIQRLLASEQPISSVNDVVRFFGKKHNTQEHSYVFAIYKEIEKTQVKIETEKLSKEERKNFVFIIDEINRGEISKIFGELFYAIEPSKRGEEGKILTQYHMLHDDPTEEFYIPENVYIIGTMNDIDRSVDTFDFAMRRRFRFVEIDADKHLDMLDDLGEQKGAAIRRMKALNKCIEETPDLGKNYQIGAAYFRNLLDGIDFEALWTDFLAPLLQEYVSGTGNEQETMEKFKNAYDSVETTEELTDEDAG